MKVGSLFSGIGGFDLGLERAGFEIAWQVEIDPYCQRVLAKHWPGVTCHSDIATIDWANIPRVDLVCGGFPCQPFSCAGKRRGKEDDRFLWPEVVRCLSQIRPTWFLGENVPGLLTMGIEQMLSDMEALGYQTAVLGIPAVGVDAHHLRQRIWILAHSSRIQPGREESRPIGERIGECSESINVAHASRSRIKEQRTSRFSRWDREPLEALRDAGRGRREEDGLSIPESLLGRVAYGIPRRVDRLRGLGNAIVPQIAEALGRMILEADKGE